MLLREKLVRAELAAARLGIREVGGNNQGPWVKKFLAETGLPEGYSWCDAFQSYEEHAAAGHRLPVESASVWETHQVAKKLGWIVAAPERGDLVLYDFDGDGRPDDHIGIIVKVVTRKPLLVIRTVEGNTSSGDAGSQAEGDGVYVRVRALRYATVSFVRIPGTVADPKPRPRPKKPALPALKKGDRGPYVRKLQTLLRHNGATVTVDGAFGPRTLASLRAFQKRNRLPVTGTTNARTWRALQRGGKR